jgi:hypothetical protein
MERCHGCDAMLSADAQWCGQCYALRDRASTAGPVMAGSVGAGSVGALTRPLPAAPTLPPAVIKTRWRKTPTTFGPVGRLLATIALVVPFIFFVVVGVLTAGFTIVGAALWGFILMPWGLRDTWKAGQRPAG